MGEWKPSSYQEAIFKWVDEGSGDAMVSAVAGSGKTSTLVEIGKRVHGSAMFLAFNKHIADELGRRLPPTVSARTLHSVGYGMLAKKWGRLRLEDSKYEDICRELVGKAFWSEIQSSQNGRSLERNLTSALDKLVRLSRLKFVMDEPEAMTALAEEHSIEIEDAYLARLIELVPRVCQEGLSIAERAHVIDYTDMLWVPVFLRLSAAKPDWVLVDEAQDLSACARMLALQLRGPNTRYVFVGDSAQAIMGFAGADYNSYRAIQETTGATEFPLSICYRCPASHVALARELVAQIECRPDAPWGVISTITEEKLHDFVEPGVLIQCRTTAPLVSHCIKLIRKKVPARVRGRDIAKQLTSIAKKVGEGVPWAQFPGALDAYKYERLAALGKRRNAESQIQAMTDIVEALEACYDEFGATSLDDLCRQVEGIFADEGASVWLSTVHRAKGLEADSVFILRPDKLPLYWPKQTPEQLAQELNLRYVALTRSKRSLTWVVEAEPEVEHSEAGEEAAV